MRTSSAVLWSRSAFDVKLPSEQIAGTDQEEPPERNFFFFFFLQIGINEDDVSLIATLPDGRKFRNFFSGRGNKLKFEFYFFLTSVPLSALEGFFT
jgi:hypothetical protein